MTFIDKDDWQHNNWQYREEHDQCEHKISVSYQTKTKEVEWIFS